MIRRHRNGTIEADTPRELADYMIAVGNSPAIVDAELHLGQIGTPGYWIPPMPCLMSDLTISIRETITEERELTIVPPQPGVMFYGCAAVVRSPGPKKLMICSIRSGFVAANLICPGVDLDVHFFHTSEPDPDRCPFDFGCFSHLAPLRIVVRPIDGPAELDMEIFGGVIPLTACPADPRSDAA